MIIASPVLIMKARDWWLTITAGSELQKQNRQKPHSLRCHGSQKLCVVMTTM